MGCRPRARSALHCHGVLALRDRSLSEALLAVLEGVRLVSIGSSESDVWHYGLPAAGPIRTSLPWCFGPARPVFERSFTGSAGRYETIVSRQFRKRRLALWAAGRRPDPYFTAMVFWPCETGL